MYRSVTAEVVGSNPTTPARRSPGDGSVLAHHQAPVNG
jgi:hypothetical protein